jgi:hypothetical protein
MRFALIDDVITEFDRRQNKFGPHDITAALYALGNEGNQSDAERRALELEVAGWEFRPRGDQRSQWGTHYHPLLVTTCICPSNTQSMTSAAGALPGLIPADTMMLVSRTTNLIWSSGVGGQHEPD